MKAVRFHAYGELDVLRYEDVQLPVALLWEDSRQ